MAKIAIIGGGLTGLTTGYDLSQKGHRITIFEKQKKLGGLAGSFKKKRWVWPLEFFPHHLFTSDQAAISLVKKVGLGKKLFFAQPKTSIFSDGQIYQFDSAQAILGCPLFSWPERGRIGLTTAWLKYLANFKNLEKEKAGEWLVKAYGKKAYAVLWEPLLKGKFGPESDRVAMSWFWGRIKKRSRRLGYLQGGFDTLIRKLAEKIKSGRGQIKLGQEIKEVKKLQKDFDQIIVTTPTEIFLKIAPSARKISPTKMIGALALVLVSQNKFLSDNTYWLNINQTGCPFVFLDEHTNFVKPRFYHQEHLIYVGGYYPQNHQYFHLSSKRIFQEFLPCLKEINPKFSFDQNIKNLFLHQKLYAQPLVTPGYRQKINPYQTSLPGVWLANMEQIYPWDRGINYAIELGFKISQLVYEATKKS